MGFLIGIGSGIIAGLLIAWLFSIAKSRRRGDATVMMPKRTTNGATAGVTAQVETSLPASALLAATMESMREGVLVVDARSRVVAANKAAQELFSTDGEPFVGRRLTEVTRNPALHAAFQTALERDERAEAKVETHGKERRAFDIRVAPLRDLAARPARDLPAHQQSFHQHTSDDATRSTITTTVEGAVGIFFDITRLERLERVRQEFLSNVSHELRTPLTAILTFVETLEEGAVDDKENTRRFLSIIRRNAGRMQNLIDDILELSAIEAGTVRVEILPVKLQPLVADVVTSLAARAAESGITMCSEVPPAATVCADARRLEQMLTNLVDNAIKFTGDSGTIIIKHEHAKSKHGDARDLISVVDSGEGIAPEHIERIFERFYRVDRARSRALGGTGLGLAIVKHLARAHGGEATVVSTSGKGSTFTIELPSAKD